MKSLKLILAAACMISAVGCGSSKDDGPKSYSGVAGSCVSATAKSCTQYAYSVTATADPKDAVVSQFKGSCAGVWSQNGCEDTKFPGGKCQLASSKKGDVELSATMFFESKDVAALLCKSAAGNTSAKLQ